MIWFIYAISSSTLILVHILSIIYSLAIYLLIFQGMSSPNKKEKFDLEILFRILILSQL